MKKQTKKLLAVRGAACLTAVAVTLIGGNIISSLYETKTSVPTVRSETIDNAVEAMFGGFVVEDTVGDIIDMDAELKPDIDEIISNIQALCGGEWSVYISVPSTGDTLSINQKKMQAASVIKLFVLCTVYDEYDELCEAYPDIDVDALCESMITVSSNEDADQLVLMLGRGDAASGRAKVNNFCKKLGLNNTSMDRMMGDVILYSDNYTTTEDTAKLLEMILNGDFKHSKDMLRYLQNQTRKMKIPAGVPKNVTTANKTGELDDVENDAAIVFAGRPYIICVMSDGVNDFQPPIDAIADISTVTYNYLAPKIVE